MSSSTPRPPSALTSLLAEAQSLFPYTQKMRRDFHAHPELGFKEFRTAGIVAQELANLGLEVTKGVGKTGVVGLLEGPRSGPTLLLRFDMDALPIDEETGAEYASEVPGVMHACGHDGHTAIGLTVARMLHAHRQELAGTLKFCFQPCEEGFGDEGVGGNELMIRDGVLDGPHVDLTLALHVWNEKPVGWLGIASGPVMAGAELFSVQLAGTGGHGASPHLTRDPIVAAAQIISALQTIVARNVAPLDTAVVSVTKLQAGSAFNVIPQAAEMSGTIRTFDPAVRSRVLQRFEDVVQGIAGAMGCQASVDMKRVSPALINDSAVAARCQDVARALLPESDLDTTGFFTMGAEDMAFMQERVPGCYLFVGSNNKSRGLDFGHHHPKFDFDEDVLPRAAALMAATAANLLESK